MIYIRFIVLIISVFLSPQIAAKEKISSIACEKEAILEASKLLNYYRDNDERINIENTVTALNKIKNPVGRGEYFDVLQVWGYIYKGKYRMRFIYLNDCTLMGEEIIEYSEL